MRIIPAIDLIDGKCVRLTKGDYATKKTYNENPVEVAKAFEASGITHLHLVDLDGAKSKNIVNHSVLNAIASQTNLQIDFGGGIKSDEDLKIAFENGAKQVTGGSIAAQHPAVFLSWLEAFGPDRIILGADCMNRKIATHGWLESSDTDVLAFIENYRQKGIRYVICTDIAKDGMLEGPSVELYKEILAAVSVDLIASGGISQLSDLDALKEVGCEGAILGKAIYENRISLQELSNWIAKNQ
jgi:phosphoribosylformimino-5-aminoimidazole carboxamide ribotide isomerase